MTALISLQGTNLRLERKFAFSAVIPFLLLFALLYAAFGAASPFLPSLMEARGIPAEQIGIIFGTATAIRLISAPIAGQVADRTQALRATLAACTIATALAALGYLSASGFWVLLAVSLLHALALSGRRAGGRCSQARRVRVRMGSWRWLRRLHRSDPSPLALRSRRSEFGLLSFCKHF